MSVCIELARAARAKGCSRCSLVRFAKTAPTSVHAVSRVERKRRTAAIVSALLEPKLESLPPLTDLSDFLEARPRAILPANFESIALLEAGSDVEASEWIEPVERTGADKIGRIVSASVEWCDLFRAGRNASEQLAGIAVKELLVGPTLELDALRPRSAQLQLLYDRNSGDDASGMTQESGTARPLQPDALVLASDGWRTLFKGEDKVEGNMAGAVRDVVKKMKVWDEARHGQLPYVLAYAAAGRNVALYAVTREDVLKQRLPCAVSRRFDMSVPSDRLRLLCVAVQLYRLLEAVSTA